MNWLYSFIAAFALIFVMPVVNNYDTVKVLVSDIKDAVVRELSTSELAQIFDQQVVSQMLDGSFFFGDSAVSGDSSSGSSGGSSNTGGSSSGNTGGATGGSGTSSGSGSSGTTSTAIPYTEEQQKYKKQWEQRYKDSVSARTMLLLATEVYTGSIQEIMFSSMPIKKGKVDGWTLVSRYPDNKMGNTLAGTTAALWVNNLDKETYCLSIAGTDQLGDMLQYIPMETSATRAKQQIEVDEIASSMNKVIQNNKSKMGLGDVKKLYLTGHSLGAFLAMSLGTDLIDSSIAAKNGTKTNALTKVSDIGPSLKVNNVYTYTFAGPGLMIEIPKDMPNSIKTLLGVGNVIPDWSKEKIANNKDGAYNKNLIQYTNTRDVVPNLYKLGNYAAALVLDWWGTEDIKNLFVHLGKEYETTSKKYTLADSYSFIRRFNVFDGDSLLTTGLNTSAVVLGLQYHLACTYLEQLDKGKFTLIN